MFMLLKPINILHTFTKYSCWTVFLSFSSIEQHVFKFNNVSNGKESSLIHTLSIINFDPELETKEVDREFRESQSVCDCKLCVCVCLPSMLVYLYVRQMKMDVFF